MHNAGANGVSALLVLRLPALADLAWQHGKPAALQLERTAARIFRQACSTQLRGGDLIAHDPGSDRFLAALVAPPRKSTMPIVPAGRCALERIAGDMSGRLGLPIESGWTPVAAVPNRAALDAAIERALERGQRERERYEFFAAVGHELRTPLSAIRGYLETVLDDRPDDATAQRFLEIARRETMRMGRLLEGMFEFSLLDLSAGAGASCSAGDQIEAACDAVAPLAAERGIAVVRDAPGGLRVAMESDALLQTLVNILQNALKYGNDGGVVSVRARAMEGEVIVSIDDDGPGIAAADRDAVFGFRARGASAAERPGAGIGLAIVKNIVDRAGGSVECGASHLGGARFRIVLPAGAESAAAAS